MKLSGPRRAIRSINRFFSLQMIISILHLCLKGPVSVKYISVLNQIQTLKLRRSIFYINDGSDNEREKVLVQCHRSHQTRFRQQHEAETEKALMNLLCSPNSRRTHRPAGEYFKLIQIQNLCCTNCVRCRCFLGLCRCLFICLLYMDCKVGLVRKRNSPESFHT